MKCIYCNNESDLTSSDIISYGITGAKLSCSFVCHEHNTFTNDKYEKKFIANLDFIRNALGLRTRDGKPIKYKANITLGNTKINGVHISNRESLYEPKAVIAGWDCNGNKMLLDTQEHLKNHHLGNISDVDIRDVIVDTTIKSDSFLGYEAVHSIAKIAYEWYCWANDISEFLHEYSSIVNYILGKNEDYSPVQIVIDRGLYVSLDDISEPGTIFLGQYIHHNEKYVIFSLWNIVTYQIHICSETGLVTSNKTCIEKGHLYRLDGSDERTAFGTCNILGEVEPFLSVPSTKVSCNDWTYFKDRLGRVLDTYVLSETAFRSQMLVISSDLKKYKNGLMNFAQLLHYEDTKTVNAFFVLREFYQRREDVDPQKTFMDNLLVILQIPNNLGSFNDKMKNKFLVEMLVMDREKKLSEEINEWIKMFYGFSFSK